MKDIQFEIQSHLHRLAVEIGPRPSFSPASQEAGSYIASVFKKYGFGIEEQVFSSRSWKDMGIKLTVDGHRLTAYTNAFSPPCSIVAQIVPISTLDELESADLEGRIALIFGDLTTAPLSPKSWFLKTERDDQTITLLEEKKPAAVLAVQSGQGEEIRLIEDWEFLPPSATIPPAAAMALLSKPGAEVSLKISSHQEPGSAANIVARKEGRRSEQIVLMAHYDTKIDTPGATDNASGVSVLLALASLLENIDLNYSIELVSFCNEEYLPIGDDEYTRRRGDVYGDIIAAVNFDGLGQVLGANSITLVGGSDPFRQGLESLTSKYSGLVWVDPWPESNHSTFSFRGVPAIAFTTRGGLPLAHLKTDTVEWVSTKKLAEAAYLTLEIIKFLQNKPVEWTRPANMERS
jgi:aminopeptidase YwaD